MVSAARSRHGAGSAARRLPPRARRPWLLLVVVLAAVALRVAALALVPPRWFLGDSAGYVHQAVVLRIGTLRPAGYPVVLAALRPLHSLAVAVGAQHAVGLVTGLLAGLAVRRLGAVPAVAVALAAAVPLLDGLTLGLEHVLVAETWSTALVVAGLVPLVRRRRPSLLVAALCGLVLGASATIRPVTLAVLPVAALALAGSVRRPEGRRRLLASAVLLLGAAVPTGLYATAFHHAHGSFGLTASRGLFAYSRAAGYADCTRVAVPASERVLCESSPRSLRPDANFYLFSVRSPLQRLPADPVVRDRIAGDFANRVDRAQPGDYVASVAKVTGEELSEVAPGHLWRLAPAQAYLPGYVTAAESAYQGRPSRPGLPRGAGATGLASVQRLLMVPGVGYLVLAAAALAGLVLVARRTSGRAGLTRGVLLLVGAGIAQVVAAALVAGEDVRYLAPALPLLAAAAGLSLGSWWELRGGRTTPEDGPPATAPELVPLA